MAVMHYEKYRNLHQGEPIIVIGNGPSLADVPVEWLNAHVTIGMNSFYKKEGLYVDYWALEGAGHLKTARERNERLKYADRAGTIFVNRRFVQYFEHLPNVRSVDYLDYRGGKKTDFSFDPPIQHGTQNTSVMFFCLQLAHYLGGDPTLIVGLDHRWVDGKWHFYTDPEGVHVGPHGDFDQWAAAADASYELCAKVFRATGRTLLNLTPNSASRAFERGNLEEWLSK